METWSENEKIAAGAFVEHRLQDLLVSVRAEGEAFTARLAALATAYRDLGAPEAEARALFTEGREMLKEAFHGDEQPSFSELYKELKTSARQVRFSRPPGLTGLPLEPSELGQVLLFPQPSE